MEQIENEKLPLVIIEDNLEFQIVIKKLMKREGYEIATFGKGEDALKYIANIQSAIILLDYHLPDMVGDDFIKAMKEEEKDFPFVIMTGHGGEKLAVEMMKSGASDYLVKDISFLELLPRVINNANNNAITESKLRNSEKALFESTAKYKILFEHASDGIFIVNRNGNFIDFNAIGCKLLGYTREELFQVNIFDIVIFNESFTRKVYEIEFSNERTLIAERMLLKKSGAKMPVEISSRPLPDGTFISIVRDITERKRSENIIRTLNKELELRVEERTFQLRKAFSELEAEITVRKQTEEKLIAAKDEMTKSYQREKEFNELKTRFISMISHEYRTPLTVLSTSSYLIEKFFKDSRHIKEINHIKKIQNAVDKMTNLLKEVLTIGRLESEIMDIELIEINSDTLINDALLELKKIDNKNHIFKFFRDENMSIIKSDANMLRKILINVITNSINYSSENSEIIIELTKNRNNDSVFKITDFGIGIPEEDKQYIFDPFHRGSNVGIVSGIGLGLTIVKQYVSALNGKISFESDMSYGSKFTIVI